MEVWNDLLLEEKVRVWSGDGLKWCVMLTRQCELWTWSTVVDALSVSHADCASLTCE